MKAQQRERDTYELLKGTGGNMSAEEKKKGSRIQRQLESLFERKRA